MSDPVLELAGLVKEFGSVTAVDGVSLDVGPGERHAVIGPNGAGKTTLFALAAGAIRPDEGRVRLAGRDVTAVPEHERARLGVARSFQVPELFEAASVRENLALAVQARSQDLVPLRARSRSVLSEVEDWVGDLAIDADPATPASDLSHGGRKRLEVGTTLATDPDVVLLDEPTSAIPDGETAAFLARVDDLAASRAVVLIEHDVEAALAFADRVTVLDGGAVLARGTPASVVADPAVQDAYIGGVGDVALD